MRHMGTVRLETERLALRRLRKDEAQDIFDNWASDDEVARFWSWDAHRDIEETQGLLDGWVGQYEDEKYYHWAIEPKETGKNGGFIYLTDINDEDGTCSVHYLVSRKFWNMGFATEALGRLLDFALNEVGFEKVYSYHHEDNAASGRVMEKAGMVFVKSEYRDGGVPGNYRYYETV